MPKSISKLLSHISTRGELVRLQPIIKQLETVKFYSSWVGWKATYAVFEHVSKRNLEFELEPVEGSNKEFFRLKYSDRLVKYYGDKEHSLLLTVDNYKEVIHLLADKMSEILALDSKRKKKGNLKGINVTGNIVKWANVVDPTLNLTFIPPYGKTAEYSSFYVSGGDGRFSFLFRNKSASDRLLMKDKEKLTKLFNWISLVSKIPKVDYDVLPSSTTLTLDQYEGVFNK